VVGVCAKDGWATADANAYARQAETANVASHGHRHAKRYNPGAWAALVDFWSDASGLIVMPINRVVDVRLDHRTATQRSSVKGLRRVVVLIHRVVRVDENGWHGHFQRGSRRRQRPRSPQHEYCKKSNRRE
jgi:hypothetical protein